MKIIFRNIALFIVAIYIVVSLVASDIAYSEPSKDIEQVENCLVDRLLNKECAVTPLPKYKPIPTQALTNKERFIAALMNQFPNIPQLDSYEYILLRAYGAPFVNLDPTIKLPKKVAFANHQETQQFQATLTKGKVAGANNCYLQSAAAEALNKALSQIRFRLQSGYAKSDCMRNFATTTKFWKKYTDSKTLDLVRQGKETRILGTVAPPGASQHLWGLAIDLKVNNKKQVQALNQNGWYRTVEYDVPHWTYVGYPPEKLPKLGFEKKLIRGITYWLTPL
ncbi:D-alanyl-D-alanine carboxypeptidase family protein [Rivularia sp. UHCC 0363]|uniref:D-alanyl-D-alanine carboxypeptidase family protein n=1 Tax=Rivularia sp. UHCC 0363 TaxID=3110244 RepID=UPI002B212C1F|nr:D-alanyl-D-alanine carboxypeptidase family protein [Rivularia sp. UHCC 0363]MEA5597177.1 D-alanyl-D-alanine carboxypeptidase family protein [Rivularia sp. UHCC 0363]